MGRGCKMIYLNAEFYKEDKTKLFDVTIDNIKTIKTANNTRDKFDNPSWGIVANESKIEINDKNGDILSKIKEEKKFSSFFAKIYIVNTLTQKKNIIAQKDVSSLAPNSENKRISISLVDDIIKMQNISISGFEYRTATSKFMSGKEIYLYLKGITPSIFTVCDFDELDISTQTYLENFVFTYPSLKEGTLWQTWDKFAKATSVCIYKGFVKDSNDNYVSKMITTLDYTVYGV